MLCQLQVDLHVGGCTLAFKRSINIPFMPVPGQHKFELGDFAFTVVDCYWVDREFDLLLFQGNESGPDAQLRLEHDMYAKLTPLALFRELLRSRWKYDPSMSIFPTQFAHLRKNYADVWDAAVKEANDKATAEAYSGF